MRQTTLAVVLIAAALLSAACGAAGGAEPAQPTAAAPGATAAPAPAGEATAAATPPPETDSTAIPTSAPTTAAAPTEAPTEVSVAAAPTEAPAGPPSVELAPYATGLNQPLHVTHAGDGSGRLFVVEKAGRIMIVREGQVVPTPFLDIVDRVGSSASEQGLLSVAFDPQFGDNGYLYVNYTDRRGDTVISRLSASGDVADPASERVLLQIDQPYANHNGGLVKFGPDGMLYIGMGDGGNAGDPQDNGQNGQSLLGKMLRIDVRGEPYAIPADNPFADGAQARPEVWAIGARNPWRFSFDRASGDLFIADVGQNALEEVHLLPAGTPGGVNLGWNTMEGDRCFRSQECEQAGLDMPIAVYPHSEGCSVTGGYVYRGASFAALQGIYIFGDFCSGTIWGLREAGGGWERLPLLESGRMISSFGEDEQGELYITGYDDGTLYRVVGG